ncbi:TIGR02234 family membrane protein [Corynebacterium sp. 321]|nr:TIGR02234 family membrane protein [Corynebacterium sp. 321]
MMKNTRSVRAVALALVVLSAAGLWLAGRMTYLTVDISDDKAGDSVKDLVGSVWDPAATPLALAMLASLIAMLAVPVVLRRVLGVIIAVLAGTASFRSVQLLTTEVDLRRAHDILTSGVGTQKQSDPLQVSGWAMVTDAHVHTFPVALAIAAAACGVCGGVLIMMKPGETSRGHSRYETPEARREGVEEDLRQNPDSTRVLWDALDSGVDPTDVDPTDDGDFPSETSRR